MNLFSTLLLTWPQIFALLLLATIGAFVAELIVGNAPKFGFLGSLGLAVLGAWIFANLPLDFPIEPRLEDWPVVRGVLGGLLLVALFAWLRKQGATR